jgi:hypothetical protein
VKPEKKKKKGEMTRTNILRAQKQRGGSPTAELALRKAGNVARVNFYITGKPQNNSWTDPTGLRPGQHSEAKRSNQTQNIIVTGLS